MPTMKFALEKKAPKHRKMAVALICLLSFIILALLTFYSLFEIHEMAVCSDGIILVTLPLNKVIKCKEIYPTELLSVNLIDQTASLRVEFPDEGWRQFTVHEGDRIQETGYFLKSISEEGVDISIPWGKVEIEHKLVYRW